MYRSLVLIFHASLGCMYAPLLAINSTEDKSRRLHEQSYSLLLVIHIADGGKLKTLVISNSQRRVSTECNASSIMLEALKKLYRLSKIPMRTRLQTRKDSFG